MAILQRIKPQLHVIYSLTFSIFFRRISDFNKLLRTCEVIPDVITCPPAYKANVKYGDLCVNPGCEIKPTLAKCEPKLDWTCANHDIHTIMMLDPDFPCRSNPKCRNWLHWLIGNVPGKDLCKGKTMVEYIGAAPQYGTGLHRYVILIFKQNAESEFCGQPIIPKTKADGRAGFLVQPFSAMHNLCCLSSANFFHAKFDCHVCEINKQLGTV